MVRTGLHTGLVFVAAFLLLEPCAHGAEPIPAFFYGSAAIAPFQGYAYVANRFITPSSRILLTVDTTAWPESLVSLPGIKVGNVRAGAFTVFLLNHAVTGAFGARFNYLVFNGPAVSGATVGTGRIPAGRNSISVIDAAAGSSSSILLTVDTTSIGDYSLPAIRVHSHGAGTFTVATIDLSRVSSTDIPFTYLINNGAFPSGTGTIPAGAVSTLIDSSFVSNPAGVFVTVDTSAAPHGNPLPGVKVRSHGAGFFRAQTDHLTAAPAGGVPFSWISVQPPKRWEELGPTGSSGNAWTIAVDPADWKIQYMGSTWGGVWKTTNGGDTWSSAWDSAPIGITRLKLEDSSFLWALARDGRVYYTENAAATWTRLPQNVPLLTDTYFQGGYLGTPGGRTVAVCSDAGISRWVLGTSTSWQTYGPAGACTDFTEGAGAYWVAQRGGSVWADFGGGFVRVRNARTITLPDGKTTVSNAPARIAVGSNKVLLNYECEIYTSPLGASDGSWSFKGRVCGAGVPGGTQSSQGGYNLVAAIAPINTQRFIVASNSAHLTVDGGSSWIPAPGASPPNLDLIGPDVHEVVFWNDLTVLAAVDFGPRISFDGGRTWREAATNRYFTDGPPTTEFYDLNVSLPDQFGRAFVSGNTQDHGAIGVFGRPGGIAAISGCGGESGLSVAAPRLTNLVSSFDGSRYTRVRVYGTDDQAPGNMNVCDLDVTGPDYLTPTSVLAGEGSYPSQARVTAVSFPAKVTAIAVSRASVDSVLVGLANGEIWRANAGSGGSQFSRRLFATDPPSPVTVLYFASDTVAFVGYQNSAISRIDSPFGTAVRGTFSSAALGSTPVALAGRYGDALEIWAAYDRSIWRSQDGGTSWQPATGSAPQFPKALLDAGMDIVGLVRDDSYPYLYLAVGHRGLWNGGVLALSLVMRADTRDPPGTWTAMSEGLPLGLPITGIGIAPNQALYVATDGRGIWWRRDVAAVPPNSGVNEPHEGTSAVGAKQVFVTTCSYPSGWRNIRSLDFKLAMGSGPEEGEPLALWVQFDQDANLIRFYNPDTDTWLEGEPGTHKVLASRFATLDLSETKVRGFGPTDPTVEITWSVRLHGQSGGTDLQQFLRVTDDFGSRTSWDNVGEWRVQMGKPKR